MSEMSGFDIKAIHLKLISIHYQRFWLYVCLFVFTIDIRFFPLQIVPGQHLVLDAISLLLCHKVFLIYV